MQQALLLLLLLLLQVKRQMQGQQAVHLCSKPQMLLLLLLQQVCCQRQQQHCWQQQQVKAIGISQLQLGPLRAADQQHQRQQQEGQQEGPGQGVPCCVLPPQQQRQQQLRRQPAASPLSSWVQCRGRGQPTQLLLLGPEQRHTCCPQVIYTRHMVHRCTSQQHLWALALLLLLQRRRQREGVRLRGLGQQKVQQGHLQQQAQAMLTCRSCRHHPWLLLLLLLLLAAALCAAAPCVGALLLVVPCAAVLLTEETRAQGMAAPLLAVSVMQQGVQGVWVWGQGQHARS
jgi:hypothetical protein